MEKWTLEETKAWLHRELVMPRRACEMTSEAEAAGISFALMNRARRDLGVTLMRSEGEWWWWHLEIYRGLVELQGPPSLVL